MSQKVMYDAAKIVLTRFLAPESADQAAAQVAAAYSACEQALQGLVPAVAAPSPRLAVSAPAAEEHGAEVSPAKVAKKTAARRRRAATVVAAIAQATAAPSTAPARKSRTSKSKSAPGANASTTMRFKKKLYWATKRAKDGAEPLAGDQEVIQAAKEGKIISVDQWTRQGRTRRVVQAPESGLVTKKAAAAKRTSASKSTKKAASKKAASGSRRVKAGSRKKSAGEPIVLPPVAASHESSAPLNGGSNVSMLITPASAVSPDAPI